MVSTIDGGHYFEGFEWDRGIEWRGADSLSLREYSRYHPSALNSVGAEKLMRNAEWRVVAIPQ